MPLAQQAQTGGGQVRIGDDPTGLGFQVGVSGAASVCVFVTAAIGTHVFDRAPDAAGSCLVYVPGGIGEYRLD